MAHRPIILKLATKISLESLTYMGVTYDDPEYRILEPIVTDDMARICLHVTLNKGRSVEEIARRADKPVRFAQARLDELVDAGVVRRKYDADGTPLYYYPIWVPGIMEGIHANRAQCDAHPELGACFEEYTRRRAGMLATNMAPGMGPMRVMPVEKAIRSESKAASYDELSYLIEKAEIISVGPCSCRRSRRLMGEGCGHLEEDMCLYLNDNARSFIEAGFHREITKEEAYAILRRAEANGLVHEINKTDGWEEVGAICNCCGCSCYALRFASYFRAPDMVRSNYVARVDADKCAACGLCVENCQVNAVKLGRRLCAERPLPPAPPEETPADTIWLSDRHDPDYRTNRTDSMPEGTAPCKAVCPAHVPVQAYLRLAREGRYAEALELIKNENPFPAVCGRVCPKPCEAACVRGALDAPVAIDEVKKFIAELDLKAETRYIPARRDPRGVAYAEKIAVIGAGPAGLSCAYFLARKGYPVTVFEKEQTPGGLLAHAVPAFRLDKKVLAAEIDVLRELGVDFRTGVELGKDTTLEALRAEGYRAFFLAVGAQESAPAELPGAEKAGVYDALAYLKEAAAGKKPKLGGAVAVVCLGGRADMALDAARTAARLGSKDVSVYFAQKSLPKTEMLALAQEEGVRIVTGAKVAAIQGAEAAESLLLASGETAPAASVLTVTARRVAGGVLAADRETMATETPDVFAGGEAVTGPLYAVNAIAAGKRAAESIHRSVHAGQTQELGRVHQNYKPLDRKNIQLAPAELLRAPRAVAAPTKARGAMADRRGVLTAAQAQQEAARCLGCGVAVVDEYMCVGCGVCTVQCKFDAIRLEKVHDAHGKPYYGMLMDTAAYVVGQRVPRIVKKKIVYGAKR